MRNYIIDGKLVDYEWLYQGCVDKPHFDWFFSLFTARNSDIGKLLKDGPYRKFVSSEAEHLTDRKDMVSHYKRFLLHNVDNKLVMSIGNVIYEL